MTLNDSATGFRGRIARLGVSGFTDWVVNSMSASALVGETLEKVGRTTGVTSGEVTWTSVDQNADWGAVIPGTPSNIVMLQQNIVSAASSGGDSGSPVYERVNATVAELRGIMYGGNASRFTYSPMGNIAKDLGQLDKILAGNEPPEVDILSPFDGAFVEGGAFFDVTFTVVFDDFEDGTDCDACSLRFVSDVDGFLGTSSIDSGTSQFLASFSGTGERTVTVTATDSAGGTATDSVTFQTAQNAPQVFIDTPSDGAHVFADQSVVFTGRSFDPDTFSALACSDLTWTSSVTADDIHNRNGCSVVVKFATPGPRTIELTGVDSTGRSGDASIGIVVDPVPSTGPPLVTITNSLPENVTSYGLNQRIFLIAEVSDPDECTGRICPLPDTLNYQWILRLPSGQQFMLASYSTGGIIQSPSFVPSDCPLNGCGSQSAEVILRVTDSDGTTEDRVSMVVINSPC